MPVKQHNLVKDVKLEGKPGKEGRLSFKLTKEGEKVFKQLALKEGKRYSMHFVRKTVYEVIVDAFHKFKAA
jgi:predicted transcriptional regulator